MPVSLAAVPRALDRPTVRSLIVETNDGIIATTGVVEGFAAAGWIGPQLVLAALCSMIAGGIALGGGRYAEEVAEREARLALIAEEREQLTRAPEDEFVELVSIYEGKGLSPRLAREVAAELTAIDALAAHIDAEHQLALQDDHRAPVIIAVAAGLAYVLGAAIPLVAILVTPNDLRAEVTAIAAVISLGVTSALMSKLGVARVSRTVRRTLLVAVTAMGLSWLAGLLVNG